jgi:predicted aldo/keto reductase-like oxidoreductase
MSNRKVTRREFVRDGSAAAAAGAVLAGGTPTTSFAAFGRKNEQQEIEKTLNYNANMAYRKLGKCGLWISAVGFGGHWKNRQGGRYWATFDKDIVPDDAFENRKAAFTRAVELGINYLDLTTPAEALVYGKVMKECGVRMYVGYSDHILCMRNPKQRTVEALMREIDEGLRRLQVDCIDIFREQADMGGRHTDDEVKVLVETFLKAREQGKVKYLGMSSHSRPFLIHVVETFPEFTQVIFPFPFGANLDPKKSLFKVAAKNDVGISCIKPFNGGSLFRMKNQSPEVEALEGNALASLSLRTAVSIEEMTCVLPGMTTPAEVENAARCATAPPLGDNEQELIKKMGRQVASALPRSYRWLRQWETV